MSFNQQPDLEAGDGASTHYTDHPEFEAQSQAIDTSLNALNSRLLLSLRKLIQQYESDEHRNTARHEYADLTSKCADTFKDLNNSAQALNQYLRDCEAEREDEDSLRYLRQKESFQVGSIKNALQQFQSYQRKFARLERSYGKSSVSEGTTDADTTPLEQEQQQQQQQQVSITYEPIQAEELEEQSLLVQEREREIQQISQDTQEINDIFSSLQDIVHEQSYQVDSIENNILSYGADAQGAARELRRAEHYQRRSGGRMLCCLLILIGVFGSVVLIGLIF